MAIFGSDDRILVANEDVILNPVHKGYLLSPPKSPNPGGLKERVIITFINRI